MTKVEFMKMISELDINEIEEFDISFCTYGTGHDIEKIHYEK